MKILKSNEDTRKFLEQSSSSNVIADHKEDYAQVFDDTFKRNYSDYGERVRTFYVESPKIRISKIFKNIKIALIIGVIAFFGYSKKDFVTDYLRFMHMVEDKNISMEQITEAVEGLVPERNQNINEYNEMLDKLCTTDLNTSVEIDSAKEDLEIAYEAEDKNVFDNVKDAVTKDTPDESEGKYMERLTNQLSLVKSYTTEKTETDQDKSFGESAKDFWTGICSLFGGKTVEETHEKDATNILREYTDYIFNGTEIEGTKFEELSYQHKIDTLDFDIYTFRALERRFPSFKSSLDEDTIYPTLDTRLVIFEEYLGQLQNLDNNYDVIKDYLGTAYYGNNLGIQKTR